MKRSEKSLSTAMMILLCAMARDEAEKTLLGAVIAYFMCSSKTEDEGHAALTTFAGTLHQVSMHLVHGDNVPEFGDETRRKMKEFVEECDG